MNRLPGLPSRHPTIRVVMPLILVVGAEVVEAAVQDVPMGAPRSVESILTETVGWRGSRRWVMATMFACFHVFS